MKTKLMSAAMSQVSLKLRASVTKDAKRGAHAYPMPKNELNTPAARFLTLYSFCGKNGRTELTISGRQITKVKPLHEPMKAWPKAIEVIDSLKCNTWEGPINSNPMK